MLIRLATCADARRVSQLLHSLSHTFTLYPNGEGAEAFFATIRESAVGATIAQDNIVYLVAETPEDRLAGSAAMRDQCALLHLFVDSAYQGAGLGRRLWERLRDGALRAGNARAFGVNTSVGAVPVDERFVFAVSAPRVEKHGGTYIPTTYFASPEDAKLLGLPKDGRSRATVNLARRRR